MFIKERRALLVSWKNETNNESKPDLHFFSECVLIVLIVIMESKNPFDITCNKTNDKPRNEEIS